MKKFPLLFFFLGTAVMMIVMARTGAPLKTSATPLGILDLEFAHNAGKVSKVITAWSAPDGMNRMAAAHTNTYFDFLFLFFYAGFLFLAYRKIAAAIQGPVTVWGNRIAAGALLACFLDILVNAGMLVSLGGSVSDGVALCTTVVSVAKWSLAIVAVLFVLTGLISLGIRRLKGSGS